MYRSTSQSEQLLRPTDLNSALSKDAKIANNTRYVYFKQIAMGGKCLIQTCKDLNLGRIVCYKTLRPEFANDPYENELFLREARITGSLQHPNTAPVYEVGYDSRGHYYFTMKLVSGTTLREKLDAIKAGNAKWDLQRLIDVVIEVAEALNYAHTYRIAHCDVKPENIVLGDFGEISLLDWGIAKVLDEVEEVSGSEKSLSSRRPVQASPLYMSPEQALNREIDERTDLYSLGSILFEILTLETLAWGDTLEEILEHTKNSRPPNPSSIVKDRTIPKSLETICLRCLEKNPDHRIQSAMQLIQELLYWLYVDSRYRPF